jgi:hypothetical protein
VFTGDSDSARAYVLRNSGDREDINRIGEPVTL